MRRLLPPLLLVALAAGCGAQETPPVPSSCTDEPATILRALDAAPRPVTLGDGAKLSACIRNARSDAELQNVGVTFSNAAEDLELAAVEDPQTARELGYLIGAARKGSATGSGIQDELVRRLERSGALEGAPPRVTAALGEGLAAGEATG